MEPRSQFLGGWEVKFRSPRALRSFVQTHAVDQAGFDFFRKVQSAIELRPRSDSGFDAYKHSETNLNLNEGKQVAGKVKMPADKWTTNPVFYLQRSSRGTHVIGGDPPPKLQLPSHTKLKTSFQYIGCIDGRDTSRRVMS